MIHVGLLSFPSHVPIKIAHIFLISNQRYTSARVTFLDHCFIKSINYDVFHYVIFSCFLLFPVLLSGASRRFVYRDWTFQFHFQLQQTRHISVWEDATAQRINSQIHERNLCQLPCWYFKTTYALPVMWKLLQVPSLFVEYQRLGRRNTLLNVTYITSNVSHVWGIRLNTDKNYTKKSWFSLCRNRCC
jgi:hypothetical protein